MMLNKLFFISLFALSFNSTAALACSPSQMVMSGEQNYQALKPSSYASWSDPELSIGLVYAKKKKNRKKEVYAGSGDGPQKKPFVKIKFKVIEDISGNYIGDKKTWFPKISVAAEKRELRQKGQVRDFAFWDRRGLSTPAVRGYSPPTSCGPLPSATLLPNEYYLHFKKGNRTVGFEIVSGPDDVLVRDFIEIGQGLRETKIRRTPHAYFENIAGYQDFVLAACPSDEDFYALQWGSHMGPLDSDGVSHILNISQNSGYDSDPKSLKVIDFMSYQNRVKGRDWTCQTGKRYLVLDRRSSSPSGENIGMFFVNPPRHRYLQVSNGKIDTNDILSQISILPKVTGETLIEVEQVKRWIREANLK